jgi:protein-S-isoprenylcysteine O-methyltransferase Ste14
MTAKAISIVATFILIALVWALLLRRSLFATGLISGTLQFSAILLVLWARLTFGMRSFHFAANPTRGDLVTSGPYRYVRNPIYAAAWLFTWVGAAMHWSVMNAVLAVVIAVTLMIKIVCEEKLVRAAYPEYDEYAKRTKRLIPFVI